MFDTTKLSAKEFVISMVLSAIFYTILMCLFMHYIAPKRIEDCPKCQQTIAQYKAAHSKRKGFTNNRVDESYNESLYSQGGGLNPSLRKVAKTEVQENQGLRPYEQELAKYREKLAKDREKQLELKRREAQEQAEELALIEKERAERLKQAEFEKQQLLESQKAAAEAAKTSAQKSAGVQKPPQPAQQQKTQIGTLKTSKIGTGSFKW